MAWSGTDFFHYWKRGKPNGTSKTISAADTDSRDNSTGLSQSLTLEANTSFTTAFLEVPEKDSKIFFFTGWLWKLAPEMILRPLDWWSPIGDPSSTVHSEPICSRQPITHEAFAHRNSLRNRSLSTPALLHEEAYKHTECFHRQARTKAVLHTEAFQNRNFHTDTITHRQKWNSPSAFDSVSPDKGKSKDSENTLKFLIYTKDLSSGQFMKLNVITLKRLQLSVQDRFLTAVSRHLFTNSFSVWFCLPSPAQKEKKEQDINTLESCWI